MMRKRVVLVVEDNDINRTILCNMLSKEYLVLEAENGEVALNILEDSGDLIAAILLDLVMPVMDGYAFLKAFKADKSIAGIPVIVATQKENEDTELKALSLGANDFIPKPYKFGIIMHRLANVIKLRETSAFVYAVEKDQLTGVESKESFYQKAARLLKIDVGSAYDILCIDIKRFKLINDLFGMSEGDKLLKFVARSMKEFFADDSICGRVSGDIFVVLCPHKDYYTREYFLDYAKKLQSYPLNFNIEFKCGIYCIDDLSVPINVMCDRARLAAATIKDKYEVYYAYYDNSIREQLLNEQRILDSMKNALEKKQFHVYFQPKYDLLTEGIIGSEALVRWIHPERGFMSPAEFIPLFEKNGFITDLDIYVWDSVCQKIREWLDEGYKVVPVSVNVSRADIYNPDIDKILIGLVNKYDLSPEILHLEITETAYTQNPQQIITVVSKLKELGFVIEMDDFGSGYSSLNMLNKLPMDILKLDMNFMQDISEKNQNKTILSFIISLAKELGLLVVAEGVETIEQVQMLRDIDCNFVQGYYYAKPMPEKEYQVLLLSEQSGQGADKIEHPKQDLQKNYPVNQSKSGVNCIKNKMLIVDDLRFNRTILTGIFKEYYDIIEAENGAVALNYIEKYKDNISVILLDLIMPVMDGFAVLKKIKQDALLYKIPVVVTSRSGAENEIKALNMGAADFIHHPYNPEVMRLRVKNAIENFMVGRLRRENELVMALVEARKEAAKDDLTGLDNRNAFRTKIEKFLAKGEFSKAAFITFDIDEFKMVNDIFGHLFGDEVLRKISGILVDHFADSAIVSRMGGDEFAVFMTNVLSMDQLKLCLSKLCQLMHFAVERGESRVWISCSVGVCTAPDFGDDYQSLYNHADMALLLAKRLGKNRYQIFSDGMVMPDTILARNMEWLLDETSDAIFICNLENYNILYINRGACNIAGKDRAACLGEKCHEVMWNSSTPCKSCNMESIGYSSFCETERESPNHDAHYILRSKLVDWNGTKAMLQYISNNTERATIQVKLMKTVNKLQYLIGAIPGGVFSYAADQKEEDVFDFVSDNMLKMLGYTREEFNEKFDNRFKNMIYQEDRERVLREIDEQISVSNTDNCEYRIETKSGELRWFYDAGHLIKDEHGKTWFYVLLIDITDRKNMGLECLTDDIK